MATKIKARRYKSSSFAIAIDNTWFLGTKKEWSEHPTFAKKFSRADQAEPDLKDTRLVASEGRNIRLVRLKASWAVEEVA